MSNLEPREITVSAGWLLASDFGYGESTPEGHKAFIPGFFFLSLPDNFYHHGYLLQPHIVGNQDDAIEPSHDIWFIGSGSGPVAKAALRSLSRKIAVASVQRAA